MSSIESDAEGLPIKSVAALRATLIPLVEPVRNAPRVCSRSATTWSFTLPWPTTCLSSAKIATRKQATGYNGIALTNQQASYYSYVRRS